MDDQRSQSAPEQQEAIGVRHRPLKVIWEGAARSYTKQNLCDSIYNTKTRPLKVGMSQRGGFADTLSLMRCFSIKGFSTSLFLACVLPGEEER